MKHALALVACCAMVATPIALADGGQSTTEATTQPPTQPPPTCNAKCHFKRDRRTLRGKVSRHPIPDYIVACESGGYLRAQNPSGAGGRYQIMPSTWEANLPRKQDGSPRRSVRLAGGDRGPTWSSRLLQDIVAGNVAGSSGLSAWSCA